MQKQMIFYQFTVPNKITYFKYQFGMKLVDKDFFWNCKPLLKDKGNMFFFHLHLDAQPSIVFLYRFPIKLKWTTCNDLGLFVWAWAVSWNVAFLTLFGYWILQYFFYLLTLKVRKKIAFNEFLKSFFISLESAFFCFVSFQNSICFTL
jgi:hypothetical protein